jgi:hypothetical protein
MKCQFMVEDDEGFSFNPWHECPNEATHYLVGPRGEPARACSSCEEESGEAYTKITEEEYMVALIMES